MDTDGLVIERVPLDSLSPDPANVRLHDERNLDAIKGSLARFGQQKPIVVGQDGVIRAGNGTYAAARALGWEEIEVVRTSLEGMEAAAFSIADNRTSDLSAFDDTALARVLAELLDEDALEGVGFDDGEIDEILAGLASDLGEQVADPGPGEPPENPVARKGDLWLLGNHRLLCGDSTNQAHVLRVMDGKKARLVATDPPYVVDYTGERPNDSGKDWTATYREIDIEDAEGFFRSVFQNILAVLGDEGAIYCWHAHKRQALIARLWEELGIVDHQQIVWVKPTAVFGRVYWHFRHEPCVMGWRKGSQPAHDGRHEHDSVWEVTYDEGKGRSSGDHPTQKPVELFARPMRKHTRPGDICFEPFSGSGSQIIAAEELRRRCYAIELQPAFVDVAVRRFEEATGAEARLESTSRTFAEVEIERGQP